MSKRLQGSLVDKDVVSIYMYIHMYGIYKYDSGGYKGEGEDPGEGPFWVIYTCASMSPNECKSLLFFLFFLLRNKHFRVSPGLPVVYIIR